MIRIFYFVTDEEVSLYTYRILQPPNVFLIGFFPRLTYIESIIGCNALIRCGTNVILGQSFTKAEFHFSRHEEFEATESFTLGQPRATVATTFACYEG